MWIQQTSTEGSTWLGITGQERWSTGICAKDWIFTILPIYA